MSKVIFDVNLDVAIRATIDRAKKHAMEVDGVSKNNVDEVITMIFIIKSISINIGASWYMYGDHVNGVIGFFASFSSAKGEQVWAKKERLSEKTKQTIDYIETYFPNFGKVLMTMYFYSSKMENMTQSYEIALRNLAMHWCGVEPGWRMPQVSEAHF